MASGKAASGGALAVGGVLLLAATFMGGFSGDGYRDAAYLCPGGEDAGTRTRGGSGLHAESLGPGCGTTAGGDRLDKKALLADHPAAAPFIPWITQAAGTCAAVTAPLLAAQIDNESGGFNPDAYNADSQAAGPSQFLPATWEAYGVDGDGDGTKDPYSIADATMSMANYDCALAALAEQDLAAGTVSGQITELMLSYYNCGPGNSRAAGGVCGNGQTQGYIVDIPAQAAAWTLAAPASSEFGARVVAAARSQIGLPYAWGGGNQFGPTLGISDNGGPADAHGDYAKVGFDCSGLVQYAVAQASGGKLNVVPPDSAQIVSPLGTSITDPAQLRAGDVIQPHPGHIFIYSGAGTVIEAPQSGEFVSERPYTPPATVRAIRFGPDQADKQ
ncbi:NlpC/P60 family protein [Tomitella cavernea]|uniref:Transglycosylase TgdA n=1 Tax=Tomitella cavernea TaxID=1387982 RepID=A0ABP9D3D0_9ACTN|nr:NlpC/P60 family protein [Tomitella cavernea]